jgi:hypothetical protein
MKENFGKSLSVFLKKLLLFTLILGGLHYLLAFTVLQFDLYYSIPVMYLFLSLLTLIVYVCVLWIANNFPDKAGFTFMGLGMLKMFIAVAFLIPIMLYKEDDVNVMASVFSFFVPYLFYLGFETLHAVKLIKMND